MKWTAPSTLTSRHIGEDRLQKLLKFGRAHFARRHLEFAVLDRAEPADMTIDRNVIGRIGEHQPRGLAVHQFGIGGLVARICANEPVIPEQPKVAKPGNGLRLLLRDDVTAVGLRRRRGPSIRRSISAVSKPVISRSKSRLSAESSFKSSSRISRSQFEFKAILLSASANARFCASVRCSIRRTGTSPSLSFAPPRPSRDRR